MSDYLDPLNKELLKDFFEEAETQVNILEQNILALENNPGDKDAVDEIFRAAHTLKGGAATVEMVEIADFTHLLEDLLDCIRDGKLAVSNELIDCLLASVDIIKKMMRMRTSGAVFTEDISSIKILLNSFLPAELKHVINNEPPPEAAAQARIKKPAHELSEYELLELESVSGDDKTMMHIIVHFNPDTIMNTVGGIQVYAALKDKGKIIKTDPDFDLLYEDNFFPKVHYYIATAENEASIKKICQIPEVTLEVEVTVIQSTEQPQTSQTDSIKPEKPAPVESQAKKMESTEAQQAQKHQSEPTEPTEPIKPEKTAKEQAAELAAEEQAKEAESLSRNLKSNIKLSSVLRVDSGRIDELMNLVSQAVINKATFNQISANFNDLINQFQESLTQNTTFYKDFVKSLPGYLEAYASNGKDTKKLIKEIGDKYGKITGVYNPVETNLKNAIGKFKNTIQNLSRITNELQEGVMRIRMVPVAHIFTRFPRLVRDLSKNLKKEVHLHTEGEDTELDKSVIEDMLDPLIHCVRNSLDHGIEPPDERAAADKPTDGNIYLRASNKGNMIVIEIEDDGRGINVESVRKQAINKGLLHPEKKLSDLEAFNLIFEPGFSTAKTVTNISGRGVGLDVVKKKIEKLNGSVSVWSKQGKGTKFTIKLPLTLAIIQGLLVRVGTETYAIPITSVVDSHRIRPADIKMIDNYEVFNLRENVLSIIRLNRLFNIPLDENKPYHYVVVVGSGDNVVGLIVDALIGEEDVVIKPLKDRYSNSPGIAGATILGDGSVSLIIDVGQLLDLGMRMERNKKLEREARIM